MSSTHIFSKKRNQDQFLNCSSSQKSTTPPTTKSGEVARKRIRHDRSPSWESEEKEIVRNFLETHQIEAISIYGKENKTIQKITKILNERGFLRNTSQVYNWVKNNLSCGILKSDRPFILALACGKFFENGRLLAKDLQKFLKSSGKDYPISYLVNLFREASIPDKEDAEILWNMAVHNKNPIEACSDLIKKMLACEDEENEKATNMATNHRDSSSNERESFSLNPPNESPKLDILSLSEEDDNWEEDWCILPENLRKEGTPGNPEGYMQDIQMGSLEEFPYCVKESFLWI